MATKHERLLPLGKCSQIRSFVKKHSKEHLLTFSNVDNTVIAVNPNFSSMPIRLEEGEPSDFGIFAIREVPKQERIKEEKRKFYEVWPDHKRSVIFGRVIFEDDDKILYRDIDIKGIGMIACDLKKKPCPRMPGMKRANGYGGVLDKSIALYDYQMTEQFINAGIRTCRVLGITELKEVMLDRKESIENAKTQGLFDKDFSPALEIRAFPTRFRILDFEENPAKYQFLVDDARTIVSRELGMKDVLSYEDYLIWFAKTLGENVARIHKNGWFHNYLTEHNVTLDCRIVDLDAVSRLEKIPQFLEDFDNAESSLGSLRDCLGFHKVKGIKIGDIFQLGYEKVFPQEERERYFKSCDKMAS